MPEGESSHNLANDRRLAQRFRHSQLLDIHVRIIHRNVFNDRQGGSYRLEHENRSIFIIARAHGARKMDHGGDEGNEKSKRYRTERATIIVDVPVELLASNSDRIDTMMSWTGRTISARTSFVWRGERARETQGAQIWDSHERDT